MDKEAFLVKAFTKDPNQGNPAGVILEAGDLSDKQMLQIASKLGFSESAFVQALPQKSTFRVRFFTSKTEVPLCGHATIAAFHILVQEIQINLAGQKEVKANQVTQAGTLAVFCRQDGMMVMEQSAPKFYRPEPDKEVIAKLLNLNANHLLNYPLQSVSTGGVAKLMIPVDSLISLKSIKPDLAGIKNYRAHGDCRGFYPFTSQTMEAGSDFHARQFNPLIGIDEDPITGIAADALGCYVQKYGLTDKDQLVIEQGYILGKGGKMYVNLRGGVKVGGYAVTFGKRKIPVS
ncbi:MAG: Phenazine biosynthesis protein PhzF family [Candidatus Beckwithbacteria bacterium GW2011_GWB1_47_15]|uniref:Phenazine biosynthesis protein PhzF family n=1 Tax=Candidatus Beckwithbacteria bacterium GW2011_GWB1_47_15 TaxID=1618371 RepID=A0A0G1RX77_9BACT|nr:MAG: phenazine biosynthesis protein phzf family [Candidatus Beckwithbacteria bacterium GW2011_GWC1_49_16]AQS30775.1 hypothetical protein [uncultured bacterium]KKU35960.1 MAG: Phenazine biosynthesis protein PhzF family [Candidatus Beckwithbacteria bacterium GW2011_GWA1_46_30]KKU61924.1 MAG: Phenazine biosynthesis protein PhzF family [Candidatus Beckwithbacteria bacterium GW2011_GWB1_47_15]KKU72522.1 MAG: Phenazine biosynthesis protein PhzF family [Candidatus Beckwithbacteria bacterium GW2011_